MGHNPADVTYTERAEPDAVVFTERSTEATVSLEPLTARRRDDGFWLFLSGLRNGVMFSKNADGWQLLNGQDAFGAAQRMGRRESDDFVLILGDSS